MDKGYKVRSLINHFNQIFRDSVLNDDSQSIDEHMKIQRLIKHETICQKQVTQMGFEVLVSLCW